MFASTVSSAGSRAIICKDKYSIPRDVMLLRRFFFVLVATLLLPKVCKWTWQCCQELPGPSPPQSRCQSPTPHSRGLASQPRDTEHGECEEALPTRLPGRLLPSAAPSPAIPLLWGGLRPSEYFNSWFLTILSCVCNRWIVICSSEVMWKTAWNHRPGVAAEQEFFSLRFYLSFLLFFPLRPSLPLAPCLSPPGFSHSYG